MHAKLFFYIYVSVIFTLMCIGSVFYIEICFEHCVTCIMLVEIAFILRNLIQLVGATTRNLTFN